MEADIATISPRRAAMLARLAAERTYLLAQFEGLDDETLSQSVIAAGWTAAGMLAHLASWEAFFADRLGKLAHNRRADITPLAGKDPIQSYNASLKPRFDTLRFSEGMAISQKERRGLLLALGQLPDALLFKRVRIRPGWRVTPHKWVGVPIDHDAEHAAGVVAWRRNFPPNDASIRRIHRSLLRPILGLSRQEFLALAALVPPEERESRPLVGTWTLKQILGHLIEYEWLGVVALTAVRAGREPQYDTTIAEWDAFNDERAPTWAATSWKETWTQYRATRQAMLLAAEALSDEQLVLPFEAPWLQTTTACGYLLDMAQHEREHADALRRALGIRALPRRFGRKG